MAARAWIVALVLAWGLALAHAHSNYVRCDRTGMGRGGHHDQELHHGLRSYRHDAHDRVVHDVWPGDSVTVTLSGLSSGAFVHATAHAVDHLRLHREDVRGCPCSTSPRP